MTLSLSVLSATAIALGSSYWIAKSRFGIELLQSTSLIHFPTLGDDYSGIVVYCGLVSAVLFLLYKAWKSSAFDKKIITNTGHEDQVGYLVPPGRSKKDIINIVRQVKRAGEIPPMYPNGWYEVMRSDDLAVGEVKAISMIGKHLVVFRDERGRAHIMDGYCPHLGANLGVGGQVKGNCIKCPFHGWEFDGETGKCVNIPYAESVPAFAKTNVWISIERNGIICVWFDAEGREPPYFLEDLPKITSGKWRYRGCSVHYVNVHVQVKFF